MSFKSAYGAGKRAGRACPAFMIVEGKHKVIARPVCPFPAWRFVSWFLWHEGYHKGTIQRLTKRGFI